ncbi:hypothetical protein [Halorubrum sp. Atlit-26R]|uniref:hypothetical protein n=1 Tax=Halorubrum sp. Atlit-26R TaxID=2282128 RepID=UPI0013143D5E|nr:hypothetical protein [Halorubrum sp. Atlit-26R]
MSVLDHTLKQGAELLESWPFSDFVGVAVPLDEAVVIEFWEMYMIHFDSPVMSGIRFSSIVTRREFNSYLLRIFIEKVE